MSKDKAWEVINNVVRPRMKEIGLDKKMVFPYGTIMSTMDWDNGVAMHTPKGDFHVLGTGEIVDELNILQYKEV